MESSEQKKDLCQGSKDLLLSLSLSLMSRDMAIFFYACVDMCVYACALATVGNV